MKIMAKAWVFGNDVSTDAIAPSVYLTQYLPPEKLKEIAMEGIKPGFHHKFKHGDLIVAGKNFGCGSSREEAPLALKALGTSVIVAESFGRIFFRNSINLGLPVISCSGIKAGVQNGDQLTVDLESGRIEIEKNGESLQGDRLPGFLMDIIRIGGLLEHLRQII